MAERRWAVELQALVDNVLGVDDDDFGVGSAHRRLDEDGDAVEFFVFVDVDGVDRAAAVDAARDDPFVADRSELEGGGLEGLALSLGVDVLAERQALLVQ